MKDDQGAVAPKKARAGLIGDQNVVAGLALIGLALCAYWAASDLRIGRLGAMGPGMLPVVVIALIGVFGAALAFSGTMKPGERVRFSDFSAVLLIAAIAMVATLAGGLFGPQATILGYAPSVFVFAILYLGTMIWLVIASLRAPTWLDRSGLRGPVFVIGGLLAFALTVKSVGLVLAGPLLAFISGAASNETRPKELVIFAIVITALCVGLFKYALKLPMPILIIPGYIYL